MKSLQDYGYASENRSTLRDSNEIHASALLKYIQHQGLGGQEMNALVKPVQEIPELLRPHVMVAPTNEIGG